MTGGAAGGGTGGMSAGAGAPQLQSPLQGVNMPGPISGTSGMPGGAMGAISNALNGSGSGAPQWLRGLQLGQQMSQMGGQRPQMPMPPHPMGGGMPPGIGQGAIPTGAVPGAGGMMPQPPQMPTGLMGGAGAPQQPIGQINPQLMQMMLRSRGMSG